MISLSLTTNYLGVALSQTAAATNSVNGTAPGQTLTGKKGVNNAIYSDGGGSVLIGGGDDDTFYVVSPSDQVIVAPDTGGIDTVVSWAASYQLPANVQNLILQSASGGIGIGNSLNNLLVAEGASNYTLVAGTGNDVLIGNGSGDPSDTGGSTTFVIQKGDGNDVISNFANGVDLVRLVDYSNLTSLATVQAAMTQEGANVVLNLGGGETLTFDNQTINAFTASDFQLSADLPNMTLRFNANFNDFQTSTDGSVGWMTTGATGWRTLNTQSSYYSDSSTGYNPFSVANGILTITAEPGSNPDGLPYDTGIITTYGSFSAEYGLFQVTAELPGGTGIWPAIWLGAENMSWPPEIDTMEMLGNNPDIIYSSIHTGASNASTTDPVYVGDTTGGFHTYGVDWEPNTITFYFDGNEIATMPTPSDMHQAMYLLISLGIGDATSWSGAPTSDSEFPAKMLISAAQFYASPNTINISGTQVLLAPAPVTILGDQPAGTPTPTPTPAATPAPTPTPAVTPAPTPTPTAALTTTNTTSSGDPPSPTNIAVSGWYQNYSDGAGTYAVSGTTSGSDISVGDGSDTVNVTGLADTITTGSGNENISYVGDSADITTGSGTSSINVTGSYAQITIGATPNGTTQIVAAGYDETITSTGVGNVSVTGPTGYSTVRLGNGNDSIVLGGSSNTVTVGVGTSTINAGYGEATVHAGGGADTITVYDYNNVLDAGPGMNFLNGGLGNDTFYLNGPNQGLDTITGFSPTIHDVLNLSRTLAQAQATVDLTNVGNFITAVASGGNTTLYVDDTGGKGTPVAFAVLDGVTTSVAQLVANHDIKLS